MKLNLQIYVLFKYSMNVNVHVCLYFQFVSLVLIQVERKKAIVTSGVLFLFHVLLVVAGVVPFYMKIIDPDGQVVC